MQMFSCIPKTKNSKTPPDVLNKTEEIVRKSNISIYILKKIQEINNMCGIRVIPILKVTSLGFNAIKRINKIKFSLSILENIPPNPI